MAPPANQEEGELGPQQNAGDDNNIGHHSDTPSDDQNETKADEPKGFSLQANKDAKANLALVAAKPNLEDTHIKDATTEITREDTAKLIGLICHLAYWSVFGHLNPLPLDKYHMK